jgi:hypothetical protein
MKMATVARVAKIDWVLIAIFILGLALRLWGANYALPYLKDADESLPITIAINILHTGNFNPGFFDWPSLSFYFYALIYGVYFLVGRFTGQFTSPADIIVPDVEVMGAGRILQPEVVILGRAVTALIGVLSIFVVYRICRRMSANQWVAWLAALLFAVEPVDILYTHIIRPETFVIFFALSSFYFSLLILDDPRLRNYILAGVMAGLAASSKYNAAAILVPLGIAHLVRFGVRGLVQKSIILAGLAAAIAFALTTPYSILDLERFLQIGPAEVFAHYSSGHAGAEGNSLQWYVYFLWMTLGLSFLLAAGYWVYAAYRRNKQGIVLASLPVAYLAFVTFYTVHFAATALPMIPFVLIAAALFVERLCVDMVPWLRRTWHISTRVSLSALMVTAALAVAWPFWSTVQANAGLFKIDGRDTARVWMENNLPDGSRVAVEPYSPYLSRDHLAVEGVQSIIDHSPDWYVNNGVEYLVFSSGSYGRLYESQAAYADLVAKYEEFFARFPEVKRFQDGGIEIRVFKTNTTVLPSKRVYARLGIYAPWLELVGYDWSDPTLTIYWRILENRRESFRLTARLLDQEDGQVAQFTVKAFPGNEAAKSAPGTIVKVPWTLALAPQNKPGVYRVELDLDAEGAGRVPVLSIDNQPISDKQYIGPLKFSPGALPATELQAAEKTDAILGKSISLQGCAFKPQSIHPGDTLLVSCYWQSVAPVKQDYTAFVHLLDSSGNIHAQLDAMPRGGAYPTSAWEAGEIVRDDYALALPRDLAPGQYHIEIGMYEQPSLNRLQVTRADGSGVGDHVNMTGVTIQ